MPRPEVPLESTYPYLLTGRLWPHRVFPRHRRSNHTRWQSRLNDYDDVLMLAPDLLAIHLGIVDAAPRIFTERQKWLVGKLPALLRRPLLRVVSSQRHRLTRWFPKVYVPIPEFLASLRRTFAAALQANPKCAFVVVGIPPTTARNESRSYGYDANIRRYNDALQSLAGEFRAEFIDLYALFRPDEDLLEDGMHLSARGQGRLADLLARAIRERLGAA
ncbi:MAG: SGNH/GDSL hydrolase family protein [Spirochaetes bacterium]|nr:SGNH/GDSL hydrolase family protein [Spirochaetota bacterium]